MGPYGFSWPALDRAADGARARLAWEAMSWAACVEAEPWEVSVDEELATDFAALGAAQILALYSHDMRTGSCLMGGLRPDLSIADRRGHGRAG